MIIDNQLVLGLYAIKDQRAGFLQPVPQSNDSLAIRDFAHACKNVESLFFSHPADYDLYKVGEYYPETGKIVSCDLQVIASASDFVKGDV